MPTEALPDDLDAANASFKALGTLLEEKNIAFDIIDDDGIRLAEITDRGLKLGDAVYSHIAVPENKHMPDSVRKKIAPYISEGVPTYTFKNEKLRVMTRKLDTGRLYFIFNEGEPTVTERLELSGERKYLIDIRSGELYDISNDTTVTLVCGDIAVILVTDKEYKAASRKIEYTIEASSLKPFAHRKFVLDYTGISNEYGDGSVVADGNFSGEISYRCCYTLPCVPKRSERYRVRLEGFSASASVKIGDAVIPLGLTPMEAILSGEHLSKSGEMEICVANTALNEIHAKKYVIDGMPEAERGMHYVPKLKKLEARVPEFKLGRVYIDKFFD